MAVRCEVDTLLLADPTNARSTVNVGVAHPTPAEESAFGKLYIIAEIESGERVNQEIIAALQEEVRSSYYHSTDLSTETAFENALQRGNTRLHTFITAGVTGWIERFNAVIAVVKNETVSFSAVGRMHAFLFRGNHILDILGQGGVEEKRNPLKLFSSVLNGHVQPDDRLLLSTSSLLDFFSQEKLKRMIVGDLPSDTIAKIEQALLANPTPVAFAAVLFAWLPVTAPATPPLATPLTGLPPQVASAPLRSMEELVEKERATERLLSPRLMPNITSGLRAGVSWLQSYFRTRILRKPPRRRIQHTLQSTTRYTHDSAIRSFFRILERIGVRFLLILFSIPRGVRRLIGRERQVRSEITQLPVRTTNNARRFIQWLRNLSRLQQLLFLAGLVVLFILSQSVINARSQQKQQLHGQAVEAAVRQIEDNVSRATAALTYDDYDGATRLLDESDSLLVKLPNRKKGEKSRRFDLESKINAVRILTRRIQTPELKTVAELTDALSGTTPNSLTLTGSSLIVSTDQAGRLLRITTADGKITTVESGVPRVRFTVPLDTQTILLITEQNTVSELSLKNNAVRPLTISFLNADRHLVAGATFQSRLYLLDTKNNALLRSNRAGTSFGPTDQWLKDAKADVRSGTSLAVDGSIYVATGSSVEKYAAGVRNNQQLAAIDPALNAPTQIWTNDSSKLLYVLEPTAARLVIFDKASRALRAQYVADQFKLARGFAVDERANLIYVMVGDSVVKFTPS